MDAIVRMGASVRDNNVIWFSTETKELLLRSIGDFLMGIDRSCTAVVCYNDQITATVLRFFETNGDYAVRAVASFDRALPIDSNILSFVSYPHPKEKMGRVAAEKLFRMIAGCREESRTLVRTARTLGRERLALVMETICATGIRVGEVPYITVEALRRGKAVVALKGKVRTILLPEKLCKKLLKYVKRQKITSGEVFLTGGGKRLSRVQIWAEMKRLCQKADVEPSKVFPHNLRHLFATIYYRVYKDIAKLADILGHSSIETTRIYLMTTGQEHRRQLERLQLVL